MSMNDVERLLLIADLDEAGGLAARLNKLLSDNTEALQAAEKSLERFSPIQPLLIPKEGGAMAFCAHCKRDLSRVIIEKKHYCPYCGQRQAALPVPDGPLKIFLPPDGEGGLLNG